MTGVTDPVVLKLSDRHVALLALEAAAGAGAAIRALFGDSAAALLGRAHTARQNLRDALADAAWALLESDAGVRRRRSLAAARRARKAVPVLRPIIAWMAAIERVGPQSSAAAAALESAFQAASAVLWLHDPAPVVPFQASRAVVEASLADPDGTEALVAAAHNNGQDFRPEWRTPLLLELAEDPEAYHALLDHLEEQGADVTALRGPGRSLSNWAVYHALCGP